MRIKAMIAIFIGMILISGCCNGSNRAEPTETASFKPTMYALKAEGDIDNIDDMNYIGNVNSKKFHKKSCGTLPYQSNRVYFKTREEAINSGFIPCARCHP